jgi:hypothetical protein
MQEYEACLLSLSGKISLIANLRYFSDAAAIRAAHRLSRHGELVQVWRGDQCVYDENLGTKRMPG